jgi:hypothetical protein
VCSYSQFAAGVGIVILPVLVYPVSRFLTVPILAFKETRETGGALVVS